TTNYLATSGNQTITSGGHNLNYMMFQGAAQWLLQDSLNCAYLSLTNGTLRTNNHAINSTNIISLYSTAFLGTSNIYAAGNCNIGTLSDADSCFIYLSGSAGFGGSVHVHSVISSSSGNFDSNGGTFDYVFLQNGSMNTNVRNSSFTKFIAGGTINFDNMSDANIFHYARFDGNAYLLGSNNTFDTLNFNNPGKTITLGAGNTTTINNVLTINATGGFPVTLQSSTAGTQATISKATDTVCVNYILMKDIKAIGGAQFYAGQYSSDMGNNTGWSWIDCQQAISNVWPGDANYDLITNNLDLVYLGIAYNETGLPRSGASNTYVAQPAMDWNKIFTNSVNLKHADCDGNGIVNANDTLAVSLNYGLTNTGRMSSSSNHTSSSGPDLYFAPMQSSYLPGSWVSIPINLGSGSVPATNIYGLAYTIQYDATNIVPNTASITYNGSWLVNSGNLVHLEKDFYSNGTIDVGMSRINHSNNSGNGTIANFNFQVSPTANNGSLNLGFTNVTVMDYSQTIAPVNPIPNSITVGIENVHVASNFNAFPNPFTNDIKLSYSLSFATDITINIYSVDGNCVKSILKPGQPAGNHELLINGSDISKGVYICKVKFSNGEKIIKLVKTE
ncbi:MAG: T9SS type A sorting domain-containing protein, partial [Bacteroidia bacterium]